MSKTKIPDPEQNAQYVGAYPEPCLDNCCDYHGDFEEDVERRVNSRPRTDGGSDTSVGGTERFVQITSKNLSNQNAPTSANRISRTNPIAGLNISEKTSFPIISFLWEGGRYA